MNRKHVLILFFAVLAFLLGANAVMAQGPKPTGARAPRKAVGTGFTYQGQLKNSGTAYTGACDLQFLLYDAEVVGTGTQIGATQTATNVSVANGWFTTQIDFGASAFNGDARWLEIAVRCPTGSGSYSTLTTRQALTPTPYALYSTSTGALQGNGVSAIAPSTGQVLKWDGSLWSPQNESIGASYTAGYGLSLNGNQFNAVTTTLQQRVSGTCASGNAIRVVNQNGTVTCEPISTFTAGFGLTLNGNQFNAVTSTLQQRVSGTCASGNAIRVVGQDGTVTCEPIPATSSGWSLTGNSGTNPATNFIGTIDNVAFTTRVSNTVAYRIIPSTNPSNGFAPVIIGGTPANTVASGLYGATIAGGGDNSYPNIINTNGRFAFIGGGSGNIASGFASTIPGGSNNKAQGSYSFAAGSQADASHNGAFVWADATGLPFSSTNYNQFLIRANGGVGINTNMPARTLEVNGTIGVFDGARNYYGGVATELNSQMINFGINEDGGNRFGGVYSSTVQGGLLRVDTRPGYNLFTFYGRGAGSSTLWSLATLNTAGVFRAAGGFNGSCLNTGSFNSSSGFACNMDIAEGFRATQLTAPGDLVALVKEGNDVPTVRKSSNAYDGLVIGVVSDNPGLVFDNGETYLAGDNSQLITADKTVVALVGRVNIKVSMENGAINIGDPLTSSSTPGFAMKATQAGKIIGYAMQAATQDGLTLALVQPGYYLPTNQVATQNQNTQLEARLAALEQKAQSTNDRISIIATFILGGLMGIILAHKPWQIKGEL